MLKPATNEAYKLLHDGSIALARIEANGMRVDTAYLDQTMQETDARIKVGVRKLRDSSVFSLWRERFGSKTTLGSREQLAEIVFTVLKYPCPSYTEAGRPKADEEAFENVDLPFVKNYIRLEKLKKMRTTYLGGIRRECEEGYVHPVFNLHVARTYRSSSDSPNFQNLPIRDPAMGEMIRRCFIPRGKNRVIVEIDFSGIEVRIAACYHKDPTMLTYIKDPTKDMHRDMAAECFMCDPKDVSKQSRYCGKNMFVFPSFYGSYFVQCAPNLWSAMERMKLAVGDTPMRKWMEQKGISSLGSLNVTKDRPTVPGTYVHHIKQVEENFWNKRFPVYSKWKKKWYETYLQSGGFSTLTGFREEGTFSRNDTINHPVQGSAFHCLLWSLIELNKWLTKNRMKSLIVGQIHDSIVADVHISELQDYVDTARDIMTQRVRAHWDWINVPIDVEVEAAPLGASWHEKTLYKGTNYGLD